MTELHRFLQNCPTARAVHSILRQAAEPVNALAWILRGRASARQVSRVVLELRRLGAVVKAYKGRIRRGNRVVTFWRAV